MMRITALNESESEEDELEEQEGVTATREAKEAEAFSIYNEALGLQRADDKCGAEQLFTNLLQHPFLREAQNIVDSDKDDSHHPGLALLYLVYKNLAAMAIARGSLVEGMHSFLQAVKIDASEVTVWYKMGILAIKLNNYPLAKLAFEQGLQCNENHWPCLDNVITVLYALNDYWTCLDYISQALQRDCHYLKGLAFLRQILKEQPFLSSEAKEMFACCDTLIYSLEIDEAEARKLIQEAVQIRDTRRELAKLPPPPSLKLPKPINHLTWKCVGECLVELYESFTSSDPPKSLVLLLDLSEYEDLVGKRNGQTSPASTHADEGQGTAGTHGGSVSEQSVCKSPFHDEKQNIFRKDVIIPTLTISPSPDYQAEIPDAEMACIPAVAEVSVSAAHGCDNLNTNPLFESLGDPHDVEVANKVSDKQDIMDMSSSRAEGIASSQNQPGIALASSSSGVLCKVKNEMETQVETGAVKRQCQPSAESSKDRKVRIDELTNRLAGQETAIFEDLHQSRHDTSAISLSAEAGFSDALALPDVRPQIKTKSCVDEAGVVVKDKEMDNAAKTSETEKVDNVGHSSTPKPAVSASALTNSVETTKAGNQVMSPFRTSCDVMTSAATAGLASYPALPAVTVKSEPECSFTSSKLFKALVQSGLAADHEKGQNSTSPAAQILSTGPQLPFSPADVRVKETVCRTSGMTAADVRAKETACRTSGIAAAVLQSPAQSCLSLLMQSPTVPPPASTASDSIPHGRPAPDSSGSHSSPSCPQSAPPSSSSHSASSAVSPPQSHSSVSQSQALPQFQFTTITPSEVQALLMECLPPSPLLSTPSPSPYSLNMAERLRQVASASKSVSTVTSLATAQLQSLALLANMTNSIPSVCQISGSGGVHSMDQTPLLSTRASSSPPKRKSPVVQPTSISAEVALHDHSGMGKNGKGGTRRGTKRKRSVLEELGDVHLLSDDFSIKRRSARVRNTRKEEENVNFQKLLKKFLPSSLLHVEQEDEEMQVDDTTASVSQMPVDSEASGHAGHPLVETEEEDIRMYLTECRRGQSAMGMMYKFLAHLSCRDACLWPAGVTEIYLKLYNRLHSILTFPSLASLNFPEAYYIEIARIALVWCELSLDEYLVKKADTIVSPVAAQRTGDGRCTVISPLTSESAQEDLYFLSVVAETTLLDMMGEFAPQFAARVHWVKARQAMAENQMDSAIGNLEIVAKCLCETEGANKEVVVCLPNCSQDKIISLEEVKRQQESLQRYQSLEETQRLFDTGNYTQVVDYLTPTFLQFQSQRHGAKAALPERHAQLELLQNALLELGDWGRCVHWGEVALNEALHHYRRAPTVVVRDNWALTLVRLLNSLQKVLDTDMQAVSSLPSQKVVRLVQNLIKIIEINHDVSEAVTEMPIASVLPWILLYRIIHHEEDKLQSLQLPDSGNQVEMEGAIRSSLMLLNVAHEYLGRHAWCTRDNGTFLLLFVDVLADELANANEAVKDVLEIAFEQCVFCLYGHPNKKGKARGLFDHNAPTVDLTWEKCEVIFDYFKPKALPEFDSYKTSTVSAELHNLLKRISSLVPESSDPAKLVEQIQEYIEGDRNSAPTFTTSSKVLQELYYLLADYYFKNKEPPKAIKFYTYDVCFNSSRLDSWAGLALAKMSQLEQKLNSMELKIDAPVHKKSIAALRCFTRAVELCEGVRKLWIEYGSLAYQLHSHASRQLRMQTWFPLTPELLGIATDTRSEMLAVARNCYWKASECEAEGSEEEWLHHYMMGKVQEKKRVHPREYLEHYKQAAIYLHEETAKYPRKILYQHSPPHLSLEALEMYYRLHAAVMKHLLRTTTSETRDNMTICDRYVTEATESPFALRQEKRKETRETTLSAEDSQSSATSIPPYSATFQRPVYHMTPQDHNYSKQKSRSGSVSDTLCETKETGMDTDASQSTEERDSLTLLSSRNLANFAKPDGQMGKVSAAEQSSMLATTTTAPTIGQGELQNSGASHDGGVHVSMLSAGPARGEPVPLQSFATGKADKRGTDVSSTSSCIEVMELHDEQGCQEAGEVVDTRPLFLDKQVGEGFIPAKDTETDKCTQEKDIKETCIKTSDLARKSLVAASPLSGVTLVGTGISASFVLGETDIKDVPRKACDAQVRGTASGPMLGHNYLAVMSSNVEEDLPKQGTSLAISSESTPSISPVGAAGLVSETAASSQVGSLTGSSEKAVEADPGVRATALSCREVSLAYAEGERHGQSGGLRDIGADDDVLSVTSASSYSVILLSDMEESDLHVSEKKSLPASAEPKKGAQVADHWHSDINQTEAEDVAQQKKHLSLPSEPMESVENFQSTEDEGLLGGGPLAGSSDQVPAEDRPEGGDANSVYGDAITKEKELITQDLKTEVVWVQEDAQKEKESSQEFAEVKDLPLPLPKDVLMEIQLHQETREAEVSDSNKADGVQAYKDAAVSERAEPSEKQWEPSLKNKDTSGNVVCASDKPYPVTESRAMLNASCPAAWSALSSSDSEPGNMPVGEASQYKGSGSAQGETTACKTSAHSHKQDTVLSKEEFETWKKELLDKCVTGLHVCLSRFPTHYKSIYRLAHLYYVSPAHKNTAFARDLLLSHPNWNTLGHMPAQGLFQERRTNNFFQGIWKIPIEEIDRSGSFASHNSRAVQLLLDVLRDLGDVSNLLLISAQLKKKPDNVRKYLREGERQILAKLAQSYTLDAVAMQLERPEDEVDKKEALLSAFRVYNAHRHGPDAYRAMKLLITAYRWLGLPQQGVMSEVEQAIHYCTSLIAQESQSLTPKQERSRVSSNFMPPTFSTPVNSGIAPAGSVPGVPPNTSLPHPAETNMASGVDLAAPAPSGPTGTSTPLGTPGTAPSFCQVSAPWGSQSAPYSTFTSSGPPGAPLTPPRKVSTGIGTTEVIDLTSPEKQSPVAMRSPQPTTPTTPTATSTHPRTLGHWAPAPADVFHSHLHFSSPFSSPVNPTSSGASAGVTPGYTTTDEPSDFEMSDPADDLAFTSPDKLTSDMRHHFQRDLL